VRESTKSAKPRVYYYQKWKEKKEREHLICLRESLKQHKELWGEGEGGGGELGNTTWHFGIY